MNARSLLRKSLYTAVALLTAGCASQPLLPEEQTVLFPPAPNMPRIKFERSIRGAVDFKHVTFIDRLLGTDMAGDLEKPFDVYARGDKIYISDTGRQYVHVIDSKEKKVTSLGSFGAGKLRLPLGVRGSSDGRIYVADGLLKKVMVYNDQGEKVQEIGKQGELQNPTGIALNDDLDRVYIADSKAHDIKVYSRKGDFLFQFGLGGVNDGQFLHPSFLAVDRRNGNVFVADTNNFRVQVFDKDGRFLRKFGELGDAPGFFQRPKGVGIDSEGNCYVVEAVFNNYQIFNEQGMVLTWVGWKGARGGGVFSSPAGLYIDDRDKIYVVDTLNKRVQVFQYMNEQWQKEHAEEYRSYLPR
jgi:DNA-binding beta-propeller fold protein YncE